MNRIYQGRVTRVEILQPGKKGTKPEDWQPFVPGDSKEARAADRRAWQDALWNHHELFQDAVNYYILALAALGVTPESKLTKLRELLALVWESADKKGQRRSGMGESLKRAWQMDRVPTLAEAVEKFQQPIEDDSVPLATAEKAAEFLLHNLGGETAIQQGGPVFFPMFCDFESEPTYRLSPGRRGRATTEDLLKVELHRALSSLEISQLAGSITLGSVVNLQPGAAPDVGESAVARLREAAATFRDRISEQQLTQWLSELPRSFSLPKNRGGNFNKPRVHACMLFLAFPNEATKALLQSTFQPPKPPRSATARRTIPRDTEYIDETYFIVDGDDPIKLARGSRGWVFLGFTALPLWRGDGKSLQWKTFDIAAFKEALKVYNQFQQNCDKREEKLDALATKLLVMDGERAIDGYSGDTETDKKLRTRLERIWAATNGKPKPPANEHGEETALPKFAGDARIERLRKIVNDDLAEEYRLTDGRLTPYGLRRRTMKGWGDVKRIWQGAVKKGDAFSQTKKAELEKKLDDLRGGEKREQVGSHKLFEALLVDDPAWAIWREPDKKLQEQIVQKGWAGDALETFRDYCETREAFEEISSRPLNFTPADARYSRRLFIFTDACSFGKDGGEYRHDPKALAVTVPVALQDVTGRHTMQTCRLVYSAPRLLRDHIRAEDGSYAQDWTQPMMRALFGGKTEAVNPQDLKDAAVQLMPDYDAAGDRRILLNFPLELHTDRCWEEIYSLRGQRAVFGVRYSKKDKKRKKPLNGGLWESNVRTYWEGDAAKSRESLYWPSDERPILSWSKGNWWEEVASFRVLAADLGTRNAASCALIEASPECGGTARFIGRTGDKDWYAKYCSGVILRLPGENAQVFRPRSRLDKDAEPGKTFREELHGARGRKAADKECADTLTILEALGQRALLSDISDVVTLRQRLSLPEQNDKLLVAMRRAQNWIATCVSWHWKLTQPDNDSLRAAAAEQIRDLERIPAWQGLAAGGEPEIIELRDAIRDHILEQRRVVEEWLLQLTRRILPLRDRTWEWVAHPDKADCRLLRQTARGTAKNDVSLAGQRGLNMARIEQLSELRRRWQSLNQSSRRELGQKPLTASEMRNDPIPDPCPDILRKLENIREQRVNQTAHLILAQALGLKLSAPLSSPEFRQTTNMHGEYVVVRPPVDMIVLEDLSRYLSDQGRAKSENTRLMKWCHRAITLKVKMLAEPFGIPVLETPAAYSSRFCSLTGTAGFRATEVGWNDRHEFRWRVLLQEFEKARAEGKEPSANAAFAAKVFAALKTISESDKPYRTLLAPQPGGSIFVAAKDATHPVDPTDRKAKDSLVPPMQADLNAAANLAFRAIAHPACPHIHHRLRTQRNVAVKTKQETFMVRESRLCRDKEIGIHVQPDHSLPTEKYPNLFFDAQHVAQFGRARLESDPNNGYTYASGPGLWKPVNDRATQWARCEQLNRSRLAKWRNNRDDIPM